MRGACGGTDLRNQSRNGGIDSRKSITLRRAEQRRYCRRGRRARGRDRCFLLGYSFIRPFYLASVMLLSVAVRSRSVRRLACLRHRAPFSTAPVSKQSHIQAYVDAAQRHGCMAALSSPDVGDKLWQAAQAGSPGAATVYAGFDATAPSLHLGHLFIINALRRMVGASNGALRPLALVGGATALIGDPSGRATERAMLTSEEVAANAVAISAQLSDLLAGDGAGHHPPPLVLNNSAWWSDVTMVAFLRDIGKHFRLSAMLAKDFVRSRLSAVGADGDAVDAAGISFTEFTYQLLQAHDFAHLHRHHGCFAQLGGSDQWGNITAGMEYIRRMAASRGEAPPAVHGLTLPLLTTADGAKFGKSAGNALWLSPPGSSTTVPGTSHHKLYQYLFNVADADLQRLLFALTVLSPEAIAAAISDHTRRPQDRTGQKLLAETVVRHVRGDVALASAQRSARILFGDALPDAHDGNSLGADLMVLADGGDLTVWRAPAASAVVGQSLIAVAAASGLVPSKAESRRLLTSGALGVNLRRVKPQASPDGDDKKAPRDFIIAADHVLSPGVLLLSAGKSRQVVVVVPPS